MRVSIITESFPPDLNGVAHSVIRVAEHLVERGHEPLVIAPEPASNLPRVLGSVDYPVVRVASVPLPGYPSFRIGLPGLRLTDALVAHAPDVVHLAAPFVLGARAGVIARRLGVPMVAVFQTDIAGYTRAYGLGIGENAVWRWLRRVHNGAELTLAPSRATATALAEHGIERIRLWPRGVDMVRFHPGKRSVDLRRALAPNGELIVGYIGRLAAEKRVDLLAGACRLPGVRVVVVGGGPHRRDLEDALPDALFLGERHGEQLARIFASLDLFVHTGPHETFCQTVQEALASGVPVVAPAAGGPLDLVQPGRNGMLVQAGDASAVTGAVAAFAADRHLLRAYAAAARASVSSRTWASIGDALLDHYEAVLGRAPVAARTAA